MTTKRSKKERIKSVNDARPDAPTPARTEDATYWVTRDRIAGELVSYVGVWLARPQRLIVDGDIRWVGQVYCSWTLAEAGRHMRAAVPDTDRECVRVGPEPSTPQVLAPQVLA